MRPCEARNGPADPAAAATLYRGDLLDGIDAPTTDFKNCLRPDPEGHEAAEAVAEARQMRPDCSLAKMRTREFSPAGAERFIESLRRAGLT